MKRILSVVFVLFIGLSMQAQDAKKAKELLDQVSAKVKSYNNIVIDFKYSLSNPKEKINQETNKQNKHDTQTKNKQYANKAATHKKMKG